MLAPKFTPREVEVLAAYARLGSRQAAAHELGIAQSTVKNHLTHLFHRLGVHSGLEAFQRLGWLKVPAEAYPEPDSGIWPRPVQLVHDEVDARYCSKCGYALVVHVMDCPSETQAREAWGR